ncbi:protein unc-93 homolog A-like [Acomys russatus]|uniref:protein unc-93 homolog A-like n=1 Tax=Acomys russatus TaxID=60746 RepID=UPI0021E22087|nr:protein unc-93 homolog A-like [Acomys russatus]
MPGPLDARQEQQRPWNGGSRNLKTKLWVLQRAQPEVLQRAGPEVLQRAGPEVLQRAGLEVNLALRTSQKTSSLYSEDGLGVATLSTLYGSVLLSSLFLPPVLIRRCGCKWTIAGSMCCYVAFSLGNFHANWYSCSSQPRPRPAHPPTPSVCNMHSHADLCYGVHPDPHLILLGLGAAPLWSAQCTYLTIVGNLQAEKEGKPGKDVVNQSFGIFFLISSRPGVGQPDLLTAVPQTSSQGEEAIPEGQLMSCGAKDCLTGPMATNGTYHPSQELIYTLLGIYTGSGVLAVLLIAVFLEPVEEKLEDGGGTRRRLPPLWSTVMSTFLLFRDKRLCLLMLLPLYSGLQQGFLSGEYTKSYVTCALGIHFVGYVMICFSAVTALCSLLYGKISKHTGRVVLYMLGAATHLSCIVALLLWRPDPAQRPVFFLLSGLWGMADAVWQTQNNALYGVLFEENKEAAFANYRLGEAMGFVIAFGYSSFLCVSTKLYVLSGALSLAMVAYGTVEHLESRAVCKALAAEEKSQAEEEEMRTEM